MKPNHRRTNADLRIFEEVADALNNLHTQIDSGESSKIIGIYVRVVRDVLRSLEISENTKTKIWQEMNVFYFFHRCLGDMEKILAKDDLTKDKRNELIAIYGSMIERLEEVRDELNKSPGFLGNVMNTGGILMFLWKDITSEDSIIKRIYQGLKDIFGI